ncbi:MAG: ABC transporter ATP-binding protein [Acidobacteriota bacterium]|nr:ABC transporter ATP-binding protein [Acidobacteriota bacterium]
MPLDQNRARLPGTPASNGALCVNNLRKAFRSPTGKSVEVLLDVSFSVAAGETVAIMGASGAGKSTLLNLLGGLERGDGGTVQFGRLDTAEVTPRYDPGPGSPAGFVFQFHYLLPDLTAAENVALPLMIGRVTGRESRRRAVTALQAIGLGDRLAHKIGDLSGGEQQRVAVARALITNPSLVLADEPTGNLDASIADEIGALLLDYCHQHGAIVIIATHNDRLAAICDRVLLLEQGRIREGSA